MSLNDLQTEMGLVPRPRISVGMDACAAVPEVVDVIRLAEDAGLDGVWISDLPLLSREVHLVLAAAASATDRIRLGVAVANFETRDLSVLASTWRTLQELAPGRVALGVGIGGNAVRFSGRSRTTNAALRQGVADVRSLLSGEDVQMGSFRVRLRDSHGAVPIFIAASGPKNLGLAGAIADGVILATGADGDLVRQVVEVVSAGASANGRSIDDIEVVVQTYGGITSDPDGIARLMKPVCLHFAQTGQRHILERVGIDPLPRSERWSTYPDLIHAERWDEAVVEADEFISDADAARYLNTFCLYGTAEGIAGRVLAAAKAGANEICFRGHDSYSLPAGLIGDLGVSIMPLLREAHPENAS